jgi:hypothetical protein
VAHPGRLAHRASGRPLLGSGGDGESPEPTALTVVTPSPWPSAILAQPEGDRQLNVSGSTIDGHVLLSYGNYGTNTGPIDVIGYRPTDGDVATYLDDTDTEAFFEFRQDYLGYLWAPSIDPLTADRGSDDGFIVTNRSGTWEVVPVVIAGLPDAVHLFDVAPPTATDPNIYVFGVRDVLGSEGPNTDPNTAAVAFVWVSDDDGATWTEEVHDQSNTDGYHRFYGAGRIGETLFCAASSQGQDGTGEQAHTWGLWYGSGSSWTRSTIGGQLPIYYPPVWGATTFAVDSKIYEWGGSALVDVTSEFAPGGLGRVLLADGDNYLYVNTSNELRWTTDGEANPLGTLPDVYAFWRASRTPNGDIFLSNRTHIYRLEDDDA